MMPLDTNGANNEDALYSKMELNLFGEIDKNLCSQGASQQTTVSSVSLGRPDPNSFLANIQGADESIERTSFEKLSKDQIAEKKKKGQHRRNRSSFNL